MASTKKWRYFICKLSRLTRFSVPNSAKSIKKMPKLPIAHKSYFGCKNGIFDTWSPFFAPKFKYHDFDISILALKIQMLFVFLSIFLGFPPILKHRSGPFKNLIWKLSHSIFRFGFKTNEAKKDVSNRFCGKNSRRRRRKLTIRIFVIDWRVWKLLIMFGNYVLSTSFTPYHAWPGPVASSVTPMYSQCSKITKIVSL